MGKVDIFLSCEKDLFAKKNWSLDIILSLVSMWLTHTSTHDRIILRKKNAWKINALNMNMIHLSKKKNNWIFS